MMQKDRRTHARKFEMSLGVVFRESFGLYGKKREGKNVYNTLTYKCIFFIPSTLAAFSKFKRHTLTVQRFHLVRIGLSTSGNISSHTNTEVKHH